MHLHEVIKWVAHKGSAFVAAYPGESILLFVGVVVSFYLVSISKR